MSFESIFIFVGLTVIGTILYLFRDNLRFLLFGGSIKIMIFAIILILISIGAIYSLYQLYQHKVQINADWNTYKCKPYVLPFAGWFVGPGSTSPTSNFVDCMWVLNKSFFDVLISPFIDMFDVLIDIVRGFNEDIQNVRQMIAYLRQNITSMAQDIYQKIYDDYARLSYLFQVVMQIFSRIFVVFEDYFKILQAVFYTLASITSPLRSLYDGFEDIKNFFCFSPSVKINLANGESIPISNITPGTILPDNNQVLAILKIKTDNAVMYNYNGDIVSGCHLVYHNNEWTNVDKVCNNIVEYNEPYIYCLITKKHLIPTENGNIYADYWGQDMPLDFYNENDIKVADENNIKGIVRGIAGINYITYNNEILVKGSPHIDFNITRNWFINAMIENNALRKLNKIFS
jgi:hypothetical protein